MRVGSMNELYEEFGLTLMVNHACNLRCVYCYTGAKFHSAMSREIGGAAIRRAFHSLAPGGCLTLGFFGGEPLIEAIRISHWMTYARELARSSEKRVRFNITTNGTLRHGEAWKIMLAEDLELAVSFDGSSELHDRQRPDAVGKGSAETVLATLHRLMDSGKRFRVVCVVRPENLEEIPAGLEYLQSIGVREVDLSLDLWVSWSAGDGVRLRSLVGRAASLWHQWLPHFSINWFDAKAAVCAGLPQTEATSRCGFGAGEIAVAPSGRLYPCERLIGEDRPEQPLALPGNALVGENFLSLAPSRFLPCSACSYCALQETCDTFCRCSNFIRTGDANVPDGLLCILNKATTSATAALMRDPLPMPVFQCSQPRIDYEKRK